jgi:hypothetical protein
VQETGQGNPTDGSRRRTPGVGQTVAIAGSIATVVAGMFGLAATEDDSPGPTPYGTSALHAAAPVIAPQQASAAPRSDARPGPAPAPFAVTPACQPAVPAAEESMQAAPSHGLSMITPHKAPPPAPSTGTRPTAGALASPPAQPCVGTTAAATASAPTATRPARRAKSHSAPKAIGRPAAKHLAAPPRAHPKH